MEFLQIEGDNLMQIKGAKKVLSCTETQAVIECEKKKVLVTGVGLEVRNLNLECETVSLFGKFACIKFVEEGEKKSFLKRVFR